MLGNIEIINIIESLSRDKGIKKESLITSLEQAIEKISKQKYGFKAQIKATLNQKTGQISLNRILTIVESVDDSWTEITTKELEEKFKRRRLPQKVDIKNMQIGDLFFEELPTDDFGRSSALMGKKIIISAIQSAEKEKEYNDFVNKVGEVISGVVKSIEFNNILVDVGRTVALLRKKEILPTDRFKAGDKIKAVIQEVIRSDDKAQILLSRTNNQLLAKLLETEVPELYSGNIEIKGIARDPGFKAKIAVFPIDSTLDPVACCVGPKGIRIKSITHELSGEKIDIISWSPDLSKYALNALVISQANKVFIDKEQNKIEVVVPDNLLTSAIGKGGQNVKLASKLIGWKIEVLDEERESKRRLEEFHNVSNLFIEELELDETMGQFLVAQGFSSINQIAETSIERLSQIEGFDEDLAIELSSRAKEYLQKIDNDLQNELDNLGVDKELIKLFPFLNLAEMVDMAKQGIKTTEDLLLLDIDDLKYLLSTANVSEKEIIELIEKAKKLV